MSKAADSLQRRFGANLSESLGVRSGAGPAGPVPPTPVPASASTGEFPRETGPDDGRTRARDAGHMELARIVPDPDQPRKEFDDAAIDHLAASLVKHGQLMPIRVRWNAGLGKWVVISGERRYRAATRAGLKTVACIFAEDGLSESEILQEQIVENLLREDLRPIEQARAYRQLMAMHGWSAKDLAGELKVSQGAVSKSLSLLALPEAIQSQVDEGLIPATTAYEVAKVADPAAQGAIARRIVDENLTRDEATEAVRAATDRPAQPRSRPAKPPKAADPLPRRFATSRGTVTVELTTAEPEHLIEALEEALLAASAALTRAAAAGPPIPRIAAAH